MENRSDIPFSGFHGLARWTIFVLLICAWNSVYAESADAGDLDRTGQQYYPVLEWKIPNASYTNNPYDIIANVTFLHTSGSSVHTQMYYNENDEWAFRFSGPIPGVWTFTTSSLDSDLDGLTGTVTILPDPDGQGYLGHLLDKWMWTGSNRAFTPQLVMLAEPHVYYEDPEFIDESIDLFFDQHGFNGFHTKVFCRWFDIDERKWDNIDANPNPDPRTFEALEYLINRTYEAGGMVHIWLWGQTVSRETVERWGINGTVDKRLQRYIAARLGPLPGWSMGYGYDCFEWVTKKELRIWHDKMHLHMGWFHFLGARPGGPHTSDDPINPLYAHFDYESYEQWRPGYDDYVRVIKASPDKPSFSEDRFRIRENSPNPLKDYDEKRTRRGLYHSTMAGGVANIWGNLINARFDGSGPYEHPEWILNYGRFFSFRFLPDLMRDHSITDGYALRTPLYTQFIFYKEDANYIDLDLSGSEIPLPLVAVDTKDAEYVEISGGTLNPEEQRWSAPYESDWILAVGVFNGDDPPTSVVFTNVTESTGFDTETGAHGAAFADVDDNGYPDIYTTRVMNESITDLFFKNERGDQFLSEGDQRGISDRDGGSHGACFCDLDNDGDYDLINGSTYRSFSSEPDHNDIFENDGKGVFTERTSLIPAILNSEEHTRAMLAFDFDHDGDLDIVSVTGWQGTDDPPDELNEVFRNDGNWNFISVDAGDLNSAAICQGGTDTDFDGDGDIDLISANRTGAVNILVNDGSGLFQSVNPADLGISHSAGDGITMGDTDNDGDLDMLLVTGGTPSEAHLYRNEGNGLFEHVQAWTDVKGYMGAFGDLDHDGDIDLVFSGDSICYINNGNGSFLSGYSLNIGNVVDPRSVAFADIDADGDLDILGTDKRAQSQLIRNHLITSMHWLKVKLTSPDGQAGAFGSKVSLFAAGDMGGTLIGFREARSNNGYLGQSDPVLHFGLGGYESVDVLVEFPDGNRAELFAVEVNQVLEVTGGTQAFTVQGPDGGEFWYISSSRNVTWTPMEEGGSVNIELSRNGGSNWYVLMENTPDDGTQSWIVEGPSSDSCLIRISYEGGLPTDVSDEPFVIMDLPVLMLSNPPRRCFAGVVSGPLMFEFNNLNGEPLSAPLDVEFAVSSSSAFGTFSVQPFPWSTISSFVIPAGSSSLLLYYKDGLAGSPEIRIYEDPDRGWTDAFQVQKIDSSEPPHVPHILYGTVRTPEGWSPDPDSLYFWAYISTRTSSRLDQTSQSCGYEDGTWWIDCANFSEGWIPGDTVHIDFLYTETGQTESIDWILGEEAEESYGEVVVHLHTPILLSIPDQTVIEGELFDPLLLDAYVFHPDYGDSLLTWSFGGNEELAVYLVDRVLSVAAPDSEWSGSESISLRVIDPQDWSDSLNVVYTVLPSNDAPRWIQSEDYSYNEDDTLYIQFNDLRAHVSDVDNEADELDFLAAGNAFVEVLTDTTLEWIRLNSPENWHGQTECILSVVDPFGKMDTDTIDITVKPVPDRPGSFSILTPIFEEITEWPDSVLFVWQTALDVDPEDAVIYEWHLQKEGSSGEGPMEAAILDTMYTLIPDSTLGSGTYLWWVIAEDMYHLIRESNYGTIVVGSTGVSEDGNDLPKTFTLFQNMPNPFNEHTIIPFQLPEQTHVTLRIYDGMGREVRKLVDAQREAGRYEVLWNAENEEGLSLSSGLYIVRLETAAFTGVRKILLVR